jgi:hypothetical protein
LSEIKIERVFTTGANDVETDTFFHDDPFGIAVEVSLGSILNTYTAPVEVLMQLVNPREDHQGPGMWWRKTDGAPNPTIDHLFDAGPSDWRRARLVARWATYEDAVKHIAGGDLEGVFAVRAYVRTVPKNADQLAGFAMSAPYAATYNYRGVRPPKPDGGTGTGTGTGPHGPGPIPKPRPS